ncbi:LacI family DNA-binding transcriptional regulator [Solicola sp. PLA-1-18]|uniref:LacI family DNA-binding transcriptional regulator n=1 Tax=Solicola sp. PLA-1-18 TaxID=3380532 RepID=UPI003B7FF05A
MTVTMEDVAREAGVSRALVSIVFRDVEGASAATRERVRAVADRLGYRPDQRARQLGRKRTRLVGVTYGVHRPFHGELVEALYAAAGPTGWDVLLSPVTDRRGEAEAVESLLDHRCEAVVLLGPALPPRALDALASRVPTVVVARAVSRPDVQVVRTDDATGARLATEHLLDLGHTSVALVDGGRAPGAAERRRGHRAAMKAAGFAEQLLPGGPTEHDGELAAEALLAASPRPTAVLAFNDDCAVGLLNQVRRAGVSVPGDLSVVGYDDAQVAGLRAIDLTTVGQDPDALAHLAVTRAIALAEGDPASTEQVVAPHLVVRSTTAPPR